MKQAGSSRLRVVIIAAVMVMALPCFASELAVLKNGFSIRYERREVVGDMTRLYVNLDGSSFVDVPTADIEHFEAMPDDPASDARLQAPGGQIPAVGPAFNAMGFPARPKTSLTDVVNDASGRYRLDPDLVNSVIQAESAFNARAVSPKGAQGLMQLMPETSSELGVKNALDPQANVEGGTKYLRELMERYNFDIVKALAAYNAGPERVERFGGVPPYYETKTYVARVVRDFNKKKAAQEKAPGSQKTATSRKKQISTAKQRKSTPAGQVRAKSAGSVSTSSVE